jgi:glycine cleavage system aminomethyltransferase T
VSLLTDRPAAPAATRLPPLADWLRHAGAVSVMREGRSVAAHYGSAATELAVCVKGVGLAFRSDLETLGISGHPAWLDHVLGKALGVRVPAAGSATAMAGAVCCRVDHEHAVVVASASAAARWRRIAREAIVVGNPIAFADRSADLTALTLVGPRARKLLAAVGLDSELAPGAVRTAALAGAPVVAVREHGDSFLLVVDGAGADAVWRALVEAGAPLGLALVGADALARLAAAERTFV